MSRLELLWRRLRSLLLLAARFLLVLRFSLYSALGAVRKNEHDQKCGSNVAVRLPAAGRLVGSRVSVADEHGVQRIAVDDRRELKYVL